MPITTGELAFAGLGVTFGTTIGTAAFTYARDARRMRQDAQIELEKLRREDRRLQLDRWADRRLDLHQEFSDSLLAWQSEFKPFIQLLAGERFDEIQLTEFVAQLASRRAVSAGYLSRLHLLANDDARTAAEDAETLLLRLSDQCTAVALELAAGGSVLRSQLDALAATHRDQEVGFRAKVDEYHRNAREDIGTVLGSNYVRLTTNSGALADDQSGQAGERGLPLNTSNAEESVYSGRPLGAFRRFRLSFDVRPFHWR